MAVELFCDNASRFSPWVSWIIPYAIAYKNKESKHASLKRYLQELNKMFTLRLSRVGPVVSLTLWCFVVYSTRRFVICLTFCHFISCFSVLLALRLPRLEKRELILVIFVRLFDVCSFVFLGFLFLLVSGKGCGLWLWHSLDFSLTFFFKQGKHALKHTFVAVICRSTSWKRTLILGGQFLLCFYHYLSKKIQCHLTLNPHIFLCKRRTTRCVHEKHNVSSKCKDLYNIEY